jgi:F-type H+-transporting ATPase subunit delta
MAELATVARPYAEALFRVAKQGNVAAWSEVVSELSQLGMNADVQAYAANPKAAAADVAATLVSMLKSPATAEVTNLVTMLVQNDRVALLPEIGAQFEVLKNADAGAADASIVSAFEISPQQVAGLVASLEKKFGRKLNPTVSVDSSLIGGVRVVVGDEVLDTSVRAKLQQLNVALAA